MAARAFAAYGKSCEDGPLEYMCISGPAVGNGCPKEHLPDGTVHSKERGGPAGRLVASYGLATISG